MTHGAVAWFHLSFGAYNPNMLQIAKWSRYFLVEPSPEGGWLHLPRLVARNSTAQALLFVGLTALLWICFLRAIAALERGARVRTASVVLSGALLASTHIASLPTLSGDVFAYVSIGQAIDAGAADPYSLDKERLRELDVPARRVASRISGGSFYGPLATRVFEWLSEPGLHVYASLIVFRVAFMACFVVAGAFLGGALRSLGAGPETILSRLAYFALNPLVILETCWSVHVDALSILLTSMGIFLLARGRKMFGAILVGGATAVRATYAIFWPLLAAFVTSSTRGLRSFLRLGLFIGGSFGFFAVWLFPNWLHSNPLGPILNVSFVESASLSFVLKRAGHALGIPVKFLGIGMLGTFAVIVCVSLQAVRELSGLLRRLSRDVLLYLLIFVPWIQPWYFASACPIVAVGGSDRHRRVLSLACIGMTCAYYGLFFAAGHWDDAVRFGIYVFGLLPASILLFLPRKGGERGPDAESPRTGRIPEDRMAHHDVS